MYKSAMTGTRVKFPIANDDPWYSSIPAGGVQVTRTQQNDPAARSNS
jgi:hypothetical protein